MTERLAASRLRFDSIDLLRGAVMILMALDHTRDYFFNQASIDPADMAHTVPALFFTRWVTHFCAPVFVLLAGTGAFLYGRKSPQDLSKFLLLRGAWMIILELTIVRFGWAFNLDYAQSVAQVIWAIGWAMIALAAFVRLPARTIGIIGTAIIALHNLLDTIASQSFGAASWLWKLLHEGGATGQSDFELWALYPIIPWPGVMMLGYALGDTYTWEATQRRRFFLRLGTAAVMLFVVIRAINIYGDPQPWAVQSNPVFTVMSFLNCTKYPPSLDYLLMTLGPALIVLGFSDKITAASSRIAHIVTTYGRVPLMYYIVHIYLIHITAIIVCAAQGFEVGWLFGNDWFMRHPEGYGLGLPGVYGMWILIVASLYYFCRKYAEFKCRSTAPIWKYL